MTIATASQIPPEDETGDTYIGPTTYYHYTGQHGKPKTLAVTSIRRKKIDIDLLVQAVIALGEQIQEEEKQKKTQDSLPLDV